MSVMTLGFRLLLAPLLAFLLVAPPLALLFLFVAAPSLATMPLLVALPVFILWYARRSLEKAAVLLTVLTGAIPNFANASAGVGAALAAQSCVTNDKCSILMGIGLMFVFAVLFGIMGKAKIPWFADQAVFRFGGNSCSIRIFKLKL